MIKNLNVRELYDAYLHGAGYVMKYKKLLNKINVFPVADGDTGNNLQATMSSIINDSKSLDSVKKTLQSIADASLGGARGNSGIIFAQYLNGISEEMPNSDVLTMHDFALANMKSVRYAYDAVSNPVEGTMLTVIKDWAEAMFSFKDRAKDFHDLLHHAYKTLENSLKNTKNQLAVLKKADVVDSGAKGFVLFVRGFMDSIIHGKTLEPEEAAGQADEHPADLHIEATYRYCVEARVRGCHDHDFLKEKLSGLGDSVIVAGNERVARIHVHSDDPESVFEIVSSHDEVISQKVDDMQRQAEIVSNRKYNIALVVDSIADFPAEYADEHQICMVPVNIIMNETGYLDKMTASNRKVIEYIKEGGEFPTSSQPDTKTVESMFSYLLEYYDSVIAVTVASALSGTYDTFKRAAANLSGIGKKITVIDSKQNSGSEGLIALEVAGKIQEGWEHDRIVTFAGELPERAKILVSVNNLENMIKGGRLSEKAGKIAKKVNLHPLVTLDEDGRGTLGGAAFSFKGSRRKLVNAAGKAEKKHGIKSYSIVYVGDREAALLLADKIEERIGKKPEYIMETSSVIAISAGDRAVALAYLTE